MILSIDTHSNQCSVILSQNGKLVSSFVSNEPNQHDKLLAEFTRRTLNDNNVTINNIDAICMVAGPGSFTGLRIGFAFVKGLVIENNIKLIKISTAEAYAYQAKEIANILSKKKIITIISGSSGKYFVIEFDKDANPISEIKSKSEDEIIFDNDFLYVGNFENKSYELHKKLQLNYLKPIGLTELSYLKSTQNKFVDPDKFDPDYHFEFIPRLK